MTPAPIFRDLDMVGVVAKNSTGYIRTMLSNLQAGRVSVVLGQRGEESRLVLTGTDEVIMPEEGSGWLSMAYRSHGGDAPAQVSFTSGTEGTPKAVLLSHCNLHDVVVRVRDAMEITPEIREYVGVPVYHSFGYARARIVLDSGGQVYVPPRGFDLGEIRRMLSAGEINAISAVPSLWRIFLAGRDLFGPELSQVRWVEIGSQYMSAEEKAALRAALPEARIILHYGMTEASRTTLLQIDGASDTELSSVGHIAAPIEVRIGEAGRIETRGPHVALGVLDGTDWHPLGPEAWLATSDAGRIEGDLLYYEGRADDVINCGGIKLSPELLEAAVRQTLGGETGDFAILRQPDLMRGDGIELVITPATRSLREELHAALDGAAQEMGVNASGAISVTEVAELPKTATGKLQRQALERTLREAEDAVAKEAGADARQGGFTAFLEGLFGYPIDPTMSFADSGGDSLMHMQIALSLERALGAAPEAWEWQSMVSLIAQVDDAGDFAALMTNQSGAPPLPDGSRNMNPEGIGFWALVAEDFRTNDRSLTHQGFLMLLVHRFGNWRMSVRPKLLRMPLSILYKVLNKLTQFLFGMKLDYTVKVGRRVKLEHFGGMILGAREIGDGVVIRQNTTFGIRSVEDLNAKPIIGPGVDIGAGAVIVGNVKIGAGAIIGANSVVYTNIPENAVVMGVPARVIGQNTKTSEVVSRSW